MSQYVTRYSLRPLSADDEALLLRWLRTPAVARWFPDPSYAEDLIDQIDDAAFIMQIACFDGEPFALVQSYDIHSFDDHPLGFLPPGSRGLDTFIGPDAMRGRGHGRACLGLVAAHLFAAGTPALGIDPHPDNHAAIATYESLGFRAQQEQDTDWGRSLLMSISAREFAARK